MCSAGHSPSLPHRGLSISRDAEDRHIIMSLERGARSDIRKLDAIRFGASAKQFTGLRLSGIIDVAATS